MGETILFCIVFLSQVLLISYLFPRRIISRMRYVLEHFPPSTHPKLYPHSPEAYERWLRNIARLDLVIVIAGLLIIGQILGSLVGGWEGWIFSSARRKEWDAAIVAPFFIVQFVVVVVYVNVTSRKFLRTMAQVPPPRVRTAEMRRRQLVDFVSPTMLAVAAVANIAFVAFVLYCWRSGVTWFTPSKAIVSIASTVCILIAFSVTVAIALRAPKFDPYQAHQDRLNMIKLVVQQALTISIAYPVMMTAIVTVNLFDPRLLEPVLASLFVQGCAVALLWPSYSYRVEDANFDVYRRDSAPDAAGR